MKLNRLKSLQKSIFGTAGTVVALSLTFGAGSANAVKLTLSDPYELGSSEWNSLITNYSDDWLLIGNGDDQIGHAVNMNNYELGANKAPTPSPSGFGVDATGSSLYGNTLNIADNALDVFVGIGGKGNVAITNNKGRFNLQDVGVYADIGVRCAQGVPGCNDGTSNSFINDDKEFPNTISDGWENSEQVNPGDANQQTRIDQGISKNKLKQRGVDQFDATDLANLKEEVFNSFQSIIPSLESTGTLLIDDGTIQAGDSAQFNGDSAVGSFTRSNAKKGKDFEKGENETIKNGTYTIKLETAGLHIIDVKTKGNDFQLDGVNFVIDGVEGAKVIFRMPDDQNMLISNSNVLAGDSGIGENSVLFHQDKGNKGNQHFNFDNTIINGAAFWTTGGGPKEGEIVINNAQGCTQLVAEKINLNDVRFNRCAFSISQQELDDAIEEQEKEREWVPEPSAVVGLALLGGGMFLTRRRKSS